MAREKEENEIEDMRDGMEKRELLSRPHLCKIDSFQKPSKTNIAPYVHGGASSM